MKLAYIDLCGFRGFRKRLRVDFPDGFVVIDGRNGVGKSTIFDAVEFALTGTLAKYGETKADAESVADYIWWREEGAAPEDRYVEVGFGDGERVFSLRRTQLSDADPEALRVVLEGLCDPGTSPTSPLRQLCAASIIRDEHIAALSLDLKEAERYALLRDAIGATDADVWIDRGSKLLALTKRRVQTAEREVSSAANEVTASARQIDAVRAVLVGEAIVSAAAKRLQSFTSSAATADQLIGPTRTLIVERSYELEELARLRAAWQEANQARTLLPQQRLAVSVAQNNKLRADAQLAAITAESGDVASSDALAHQARDLSALAVLGRKLGLHDGHCPLCASERTDADFANGLALAENYARHLNQQAVEQAERERARKATENGAAQARAELDHCERTVAVSQATVDEFEKRLVSIGLPATADVTGLEKRHHAVRTALDQAREDLRIVETLQLNAALERANRAEGEAKEAHSRALGRLGTARRAEGRAQVLHDATRRAAGEAVDRRFERVLPLMAELYRRLRPHPVWSDIEYKIRGDVRRFLKLEVGNGLNPQFMFSSGQRRATGLAFLLSVNLSLAWSRWETILLDDPVQHVDDFRSVQLAEVMAQLCAGGRQIICAVEDAALAELICRRLPLDGNRHGKRITLGPDEDGALSKLQEKTLAPLVQRVLITDQHLLAG